VNPATVAVLMVFVLQLGSLCSAAVHSSRTTGASTRRGGSGSAVRAEDCVAALLRSQ
jgi:hypothetical protein